jgi:hypothetical protein
MLSNPPSGIAMQQPWPSCCGVTRPSFPLAQHRKHLFGRDKMLHEESL